MWSYIFCNWRRKIWNNFVKLYVPVVSLSTQDNAKLLQRLKSGFKRTINWNKNQSKVIIQARHPYLDYLIDPGFQGVNRLFVLSFGNNTDRTVHTRYYLPKVEIKYYSVMIHGQNFFDQPVKNDMKTYVDIWKVSTGHGDDYTAGCLLDYPYFKEHYELIAIDLIKQQALDADPKPIQQINFTENLNQGRNINDNTTMFLIIEETKETVLGFSQETVKVLPIYFTLI